MFHRVLRLCLLFSIVKTQVIEQQLLSKLACIEHETCGACLSAAPHCRWCADPYLGTNTIRCNHDESLVAAGCSQEMIQRPEPPFLDVTEDRSLQDMAPDSHEAVVQLQPQRVKLSLKPRETRKIKFSYRPAKNYPLDLYYLMDLTWSMKDDKETLVSLRDDLPNLLKNLTDNFRIGFGSFADKPLMPFISMDPKHIANPCWLEDGECEPTYSFHHHLSLTSEVKDFIKRVNNTHVTANLDNAEAQLDALMQVVVCGNKIGWSPHSRKVVILLSDGLMHTAGDGKLGGAVMRNDEQCHLDENGYHSDNGVYDYPSIAQIYRLLDKHKVKVIFAVTDKVKPYYESLHDILEDFTYIAKLESDSSNILKLVKTGYEGIVSLVEFDDDASEGPVKTKYFTDCGIQGGSMMETTRCAGVEFGMTLNYEVHVSLDACPEFKSSKQTILISETQLGQDSLTLEVDVQCGCNCEGPQQRDMSAACPVNSHLVCGVCECDKGWSGPNCDCSMGDEAASSALNAQCREPNSTRTLACSGAGDCLCGACDCDPGRNGKYCQCKACGNSRENGMECGGVGQGVCVCGECACAEGWSGATCDCTAETETCIAPGGDQLCSGRGDCVCGRCQCSTETDGVKYSGLYCETCASCENKLCAHAEPCVSCYLEKNCTDVCVTATANYTVAMKLNEIADSAETSCILRLEEDNMECEYQYTYNKGIGPLVHMDIVIRRKECSQPTSARIMASGLIVMVCVVAAGIIVIMAIKIAQIVSDRRAYAKFAAEAERSMLFMNEREQNPLYISPISEFRLPDSFPRDKND